MTVFSGLSHCDLLRCGLLHERLGSQVARRKAHADSGGGGRTAGGGQQRLRHGPAGRQVQRREAAGVSCPQLRIDSQDAISILMAVAVLRKKEQTVAL